MWFSLVLASTRNWVLKSFPEIEYLAECDPDSNDIVKTNMLDTYYPNRSPVLENLCLYEVLQYYTYRNNVEENIESGKFGVSGCSGCLVRHNKASLINHQKLSCQTAEK